MGERCVLSFYDLGWLGIVYKTPGFGELPLPAPPSPRSRNSPSPSTAESDPRGPPACLIPRHRSRSSCLTISRRRRPPFPASRHRSLRHSRSRPATSLLAQTRSAFRCPPPPASHDLPSHPLLPQAHSIPFFLPSP